MRGGTENERERECKRERERERERERGRGGGGRGGVGAGLEARLHVFERVEDEPCACRGVVRLDPAAHLIEGLGV